MTFSLVEQVFAPYRGRLFFCAHSAEDFAEKSLAEPVEIAAKGVEGADSAE